MSALHNKKILLGLSGGIAAYKAAELARELAKAGADLRVVMTPSACEFIQPLTLQTLTGHPVYLDTFETEHESGMDHIELARWAELVLIAPASANTIAKLAHGEADNLLLTIILASQAPLALAPAMNEKMYAHPATQQNLATLSRQGAHLWGPASGEQACGDDGPGRMLEAMKLRDLAAEFFSPGPLAGHRILITAGPTREAIDPVRYVSNHSSGKMGYALATAAQQANADVTLITGPTCLPAPPVKHIIAVDSAQEMYDAVFAHLDDKTIFIATAAVADYRPATVAEQKIKKHEDAMVLEMIKNPDILQAVASRDDKPFCLGFAAETEKLEEHGRAKLKRKNIDLIAINNVAGSDGAFNNDANEILLLGKNYRVEIPRADKTAIASSLIEHLADAYNARR